MSPQISADIADGGAEAERTPPHLRGGNAFGAVGEFFEDTAADLR